LDGVFSGNGKWVPERTVVVVIAAIIKKNPYNKFK